MIQKYMVETTKTPFQSMVDWGIHAINKGGSIQSVMIFIERSPMFQQSNFSFEEIKDEIEFWVGKPKKK
jgi:hypothetical protein